MTLPGKNDIEKMKSLSEAKTFQEQAIWFLNGFWKTIGNKEAENIWNFKHRMAALDQVNGKDGHSLDEMMAHRFLETIGETLTVRELRDKLDAVGIERPKYISLAHYLTIRYKVDWHEFVNAAQGDNQEEVKRAQQMLQAVQKAFEEVKRTADEAVVREREAKVAERAAQQAQAELEKSLAELKAQEDAYNNKTNELKRKTTEGGVVAQNKAKAELAQHLAEDPLPLRRAKITNEAAVKKAEKATQAAKEATQAAIAARTAAEAAVNEAAKKLREAEAYLEEVKNKPGSAQGALWWIDRELHEAKAFLPESKGGYKKQK